MDTDISSCAVRRRSLVLKNAAYPPAIKQLKKQKILDKDSELRQVKYLNNLIEQDHQFIKRLVRPGLGFKSFHTARRTIQGYEMMNAIRKGQISSIKKGLQECLTK